MWRHDTLNHTSHFTNLFKKNFNPILPYGEFKFERWTSKLLFSLNKGLNYKKKS
jgi:hypothetical protein